MWIWSKYSDENIDSLLKHVWLMLCYVKLILSCVLMRNATSRFCQNNAFGIKWVQWWVIALLSTDAFLIFPTEQEEMKRRNYLDQVCFLFADGTDKSCVSSNETDGWVHDDVNTRITFPCPYNSNRSHFHSKCISFSTDARIYSVNIISSCINRPWSEKTVHKLCNCLYSGTARSWPG